MRLDNDLPGNDTNSDPSSSTITPEYVCYSYGPIPNEQESELMAGWFGQRNIVFNKRQTPESGEQNSGFTSNPMTLKLKHKRH